MTQFPNRLLDLVYIPDLTGFLSDLAELAESEEWNYQIAQSEHDLPILYNYIVHTYSRLVELSRIELSDDDQFLTYNTGLITANHEEIFCFLGRSKFSNSRCPWYFHGWRKRSDRDLTRFSALPEMASYFDDPTCLVFDTRKDFRVNVDHIVEENKDRFPTEFQSRSNYELATSVSGSIENAKRRVRRNYKTAIPQYYHGKVQLLLPLCLSDSSKADLALVVDDCGAFYRANTCLTLDMAFNNARQLAKPDRDWLKP